MSTKIKLSELDVGQSFPATWTGQFSQTPKTGEVEDKKAIIQKLMNDHKRTQVKKREASPGFKLVFGWERKSEDPVTYELTVDLDHDDRFGDDEGEAVPPTPLKPPPPPK